MHRRNLLGLISKGMVVASAGRWCTLGAVLGGSVSAALAEPATAAPSNLPTGWHWLAGGSTPQVKATPQLPITVTDGTGARVGITDISRIIVGGEDIADILAALGLADNIYAAPDNSVAPAALQAPHHYRFSQKTSIEGLLQLSGTLFIGNNLQRHASVAAGFRAAGVAAVVVDNRQTIPAKIKDVGRYVGAAASAQQLAARVQAQLDQAHDLAQARHTRSPRVMAVTSSGAGGRSAVFGAGTAVANMLESLGAIDVGSRMGLVGYSVKFSNEGLLKADPDAILMGDGDLAAWGGLSGFLAAFPSLMVSRAGRNNAFFVMPSELIKVGGVGVGAGSLALAHSDALFASVNANG